MLPNELHNVTAYSGTKPYVFISYAHNDADRVLPAIAALQKKGYRIWLDIGIEAGTEWSSKIAQRLRECAVVLAFVSPSFAASENCQDEIAYAKSNQKPTLLVYLEDQVALPEGMEMQTARFQRMFMSRQRDNDDFAEHLNQSGMFDACIEQPEDAPAPQPTPQPAPQPAHQPQASKKGPNWVAIGIAAAAAVLVIVLLVVLMGGNDLTDGPFYIYSAEADGVVMSASELDDYLWTFDATVLSCYVEFYSDGTGILVVGSETMVLAYDDATITTPDYPDDALTYVFEDEKITISSEDISLTFAR